jgi:hypothetical protein
VLIAFSFRECHPKVGTHCGCVLDGQVIRTHQSINRLLADAFTQCIASPQWQAQQDRGTERYNFVS